MISEHENCDMFAPKIKKVRACPKLSMLQIQGEFVR